MTGERALTAPEMTPSVDAADAPDRLPEDHRGVVGGTPGAPGTPDTPGTPGAPGDSTAPGQVPGLGGPLEGRSRLGMTEVPESDEKPEEPKA
jgi:hypothetical protein